MQLSHCNGHLINLRTDKSFYCCMYIYLFVNFSAFSHKFTPITELFLQSEGTPAGIPPPSSHDICFRKKRDSPRPCPSRRTREEKAAPGSPQRRPRNTARGGVVGGAAAGTPWAGLRAALLSALLLALDVTRSTFSLFS